MYDIFLSNEDTMKNLLRKKANHPDKNENIKSTNLSNKISKEDQKTALENGSFSKINIPLTQQEIKYRKMPILPILLTVLVLFFGFAAIFGLIPALQTKSKAEILVEKGKELSASLKQQNLDEAKKKFPEVKTALDEVRMAWDKALFFKITPGLNRYHKDGMHAINAASYGLDSLDIMLTTIEPYADLLGFKGGSSFVTGSADERIQVAVKTMDKVTPKIADIGAKIEKLKAEIDKIDPMRYPESFRGKQVRVKLVEGKKLIDETATLFLNARPLLEVLPQLLGEPQPKRYIVLFQNDKELRPTGGFLTAYANFRVEHGKFIVEKSDDIYELDGQIKSKREAPPEILIYHKGVYYFNIRDSNLSPDFSLSMKQFIDLYPGKFDFDGIITVDTHVLVEAMKILGDFTIAGRKFSAETDKRCNCPGVIYELEDYATRPVAYVRETRKDIIGSLLLEIMKKALGVSPSQYWGRLFQMALSEINEKHILAYMLDEKAQKGIESLNMGGRIADGVGLLGYKDGEDWDYLHINDANMAGAKSNLFVIQAVKQEFSDAQGNLVKTITLDYKNPAPPSDCNLESGGLCLNGLLRNWIRVYVPLGSTLLESIGSESPKDGSAEDMKSRDELGKTVLEGFVTVRPLGSAQLVVKYKLPFKKKNEPLNLLIQKQAGTIGHEYIITANGKQKEKFALTSDKVVTISW